MAAKGRTRASWEPAQHTHFYPGITANQTVATESQIVLSITAANLGAAAANLKIFDGTTQIATLSVPANDTRSWPPDYPGVIIANLNVTPSAALDVSVTNA